MPMLLPAIKSKMGDLEYYATVMTLGEVARLVDYAEDVQQWNTGSLAVADRTQRKVNRPRVVSFMVPYLTDNEDHFFSSLVVEVVPPDGGSGPLSLRFQPSADPFNGDRLGSVILHGTERLYALDGQHRLLAIQLALKAEPALAEESISVILVPHKSVKRSQQLFTDLNRYAKQPEKSLNLMFDHRDAVSVVAKALEARVSLLQDRVNYETTTLSKPHIFITFSTLHETVRNMVSPDEELTDEEFDERTDQIVTMWEVLTKAIPQWSLIQKGKLVPGDARKDYISAWSVGQNAIWTAACAVRDQEPDNWKKIVHAAFSKIPWAYREWYWEGIAVVAGRVSNTRSSVRLSAVLLKHAAGLEIEDKDGDALLQVLQHVHDLKTLPRPLV